MLKTITVLLLMTILYVNCDGGYMDPSEKSQSSKRRGSTGTTTGGTTGGSIGPGGSSITPPPNAPAVANPGDDSEEDGPGCSYSPPFDMTEELQQVVNDITNCEGQPLATMWLIEAVRKLQAIDSRFGFMIKDNGAKIPRDIITFNWTNEGDGSHNFYVFDVVVSGCNNSPGDPTFEDPSPGAHVGWQFCNPDGYAGNGTFGYDPY